MRERRVACEANTRPARRLQMRTPQRKAGERGGSVTPPRPAAAPGASWRSSAGGALRKPTRRAQRARMGGAGRAMPTAHPHTGAGGERAPTERPARADRLCKAGAATGAAGCGLANAGGLCNGWRAPSSATFCCAGWKEGGACADPRATFVERAKRAELARRPAARVGRGRPAGRGVRAAAARQQGAPLPCSGYRPVGPCKREACAQPGRMCERVAWVRYL